MTTIGVIIIVLLVIIGLNIAADGTHASKSLNYIYDELNSIQSQLDDIQNKLDNIKE